MQYGARMPQIKRFVHNTPTPKLFWQNALPPPPSLWIKQIMKVHANHSVKKSCFWIRRSCAVKRQQWTNSSKNVNQNSQDTSRVNNESSICFACTPWKTVNLSEASFWECYVWYILISQSAHKCWLRKDLLGSSLYKHNYIKMKENYCLSKYRLLFERLHEL